jgi:VWFA-related protein
MQGNPRSARDIHNAFSTNMKVTVDRRRFLGSSLLALGAARLSAYQKDAPPTFTTDLNVVNLLVTVRDKHGALVKGLTKNDFTLLEDSRPQVVRYFTQETNQPLILGLLVDTSGSERRMIGEERDASETFFEQVLRPELDKAFLIHFDREVELLQDLTSSRQKLEKALSLLHAYEPGGQNQGDPTSPGSSGGGQSPSSSGGTWPGGGVGRWPGGGGGWPGGGGGGTHRGGGHRGGYGSHGGGTKLYDALLLSADELMAKEKGRKAVILLTDGEDNGSKTPLEQAVQSAQRADTLAYAVRISDPNEGGFGRVGMGPYGGRGGGIERPDGRKILQQISRETGGAFFEVSKKKSVGEIFSEIQEELRNQYSIGYTPDRALSEGGYRKIQLTINKKDCVVQTREGYYAKAT